MTTTIAPTPPAVPRTTFSSAFELSQAVIDEIYAGAGAHLAKQKLSALDKERKRREAFDRAWHYSDSMLLREVIRFEKMDDGERAARIRAHAHGESRWLEANPGDDLDAQRIGVLRGYADKDIERAAEFATALNIVDSIEQDWEEGAPSKTHQRIKELMKRAIDDASSSLSSGVMQAQAELVVKLAWMNHSWRWQRRWELERITHRGVRVSRIDVPLRLKMWCSFEACIRNVETRRDVKTLLEVWGEPAELVRDAEGTRFVGRGFTIYARN